MIKADRPCHDIEERAISDAPKRLRALPKSQCYLVHFEVLQQPTYSSEPLQSSCGTIDLPTRIDEDDDDLICHIKNKTHVPTPPLYNKLKSRSSLMICLHTSILRGCCKKGLSSRPSPLSKTSRTLCTVTAQTITMRLWQIKIKVPLRESSCRVPRSYWQAEAVLAGLLSSDNPSHEARFYP